MELGRGKDISDRTRKCGVRTNFNNDVDFIETPEFMIRRWCGEMGVPYLGRCEIGHVALNRVVPFGVSVQG